MNKYTEILQSMWKKEEKSSSFKLVLLRDIPGYAKGYEFKICGNVDNVQHVYHMQDLIREGWVSVEHI